MAGAVEDGSCSTVVGGERDEDVACVDGVGVDVVVVGMADDQFLRAAIVVIVEVVFKPSD